MRDHELIEREIYRAREDLEDSLADLKHTVQEKLDVRARARVAVAKGKQAAQDAFETGKTRAVDLYVKAKDRPVLVSAIVGGVVAAGALAYIGRRRDWW